MKAETVLRRLRKDLMTMSDEEYNKLLDITRDGAEDFLFLGVQKVSDWIESADSKTDKKAA